MMKRLAIAWLLVAPFRAAAPQAVPEIRFDANVSLLQLPPATYLGEVAGVALNSRHHIFVFSRTSQRSTVHGAAAAQLFEFGADGTFIREIGQGVYGFAFAHTVRIDRADNIWTADEGTNMIVKFAPDGRVLMVLGRREEAVEPAAPAAPGAAPPRAGWGTFNRPTDVAWDPAGNSYIADGYTNSRVVKVDRNGRWVKAWGTRGTEPGQFNILHSIATDARGNVYVGDRTNRRIQVFDTEGTFLRQFTIDVPFTKEPNVMVGAGPGSGANPLAASGAPWAICITPGPRSSCTSPTPYRVASTSSRSTARSSACSARRGRSRSNSAGSTRSPARRRTSSTSPSC